MAIQSNFPAIKPTLLLDFANVEQLDPRISFSRASTATFYGTQTAKAEENLLLQSQDFTTSWTTAFLTVTSNSSTAPDGTTTAETLTDDATADRHTVSQAISTQLNTNFVFSCFLKAGTGNFAALSLMNNISINRFATVVVDLSTGTISDTNNSANTTATSSITSIGSGWYRVVLSASQSSTAFNAARICVSDSGTPSYTNFGQPTYSGSGSTIEVWGAQLEQRSAVTAYTPTTTQPITNYIPVLQTAASGVARFDHNPTTFESFGLEIEESRTNLLTYSEQFDNAAWGKTRSSITANSTVAPDGTLTGDSLIADTAASTTHFATQSASFTSGGVYTVTLYAKQAGLRYVRLGFSATAFGAIQVAFFDLQDGVVTSTSGTVTTSIQNVGNGWWRVSVTATATATASDTISINLALTGVSSNFTGDGYSGLYIWGAQLEAGAFPTSYVATVASQVTRAADAASITGTNFSSWFNQQQGSLYLDTTPRQTGTQYPAIIGDGISATLGIGFFTDVGNLQARIRGTGGSSTITGSIAITANTAFKAMLSYAAYNNAWAYNGANRATGNTNIKPENSVNLRIGSDPVGNNVYTGTIKKLSFYPVKLTDAEMNALTS